MRTFILLALVLTRAVGAQSPQRYPCRSEHTFDFWVGTWDAAPWDKPQAKPTGVLENTRTYEGCVFIEHFSLASGEPIGMSMVFYDINRKAWRMIWDDSRNTSNDFEGSYHDGAMRFLGWILDAQGRRILASNVLENISPDTIKHTYALSSDSGKTWVPQSVGRFVRRHTP